jgi:hypothetical protein
MSHVDKSHDEFGTIESTLLGMDSSMDVSMVPTPVQETGIPSPTPSCAHQRLIDDVRTRSGKPTGKVRCLECGTTFADPNLSVD